MLRQALILAAGRGRPVADPDMPNCLATVGGMPLLAPDAPDCWPGAASGGWGSPWAGRGLVIRRRLEEHRAPPLALTPGRRMSSCFENADWDGPNGLSVLAARRFVTEPTLLLMADQVAAPALIERFVRLPARRADRAGHRPRSVARVRHRRRHQGGAGQCSRAGGLRVTRMGKELTDYEAVSTSLFVLAPSLLEALDALPEPSLTQGVAEAAAGGLVDALDVTGAVWQDVDSAEMRLHAEWLLRAYGDELARPIGAGAGPVPGQPDAGADRTAAGREGRRPATRCSTRDR